MSGALKYVHELRERNHQIQQVVEKINKCSYNKHYLDTLTSEYAKLCKRLEDLNRMWEKDYLPAVERRQALCRELYIAENQPGDFQNEVFKKLQQSSREVIESLNNELQETLAEARLYKMQLRDGLLPLRQRAEPDQGSKPPVSSTNEEPPTAQDSGKKRNEPGRKARMSWSIGAANEELAKLEAEHTRVAQSMRSVGTQSCELAAKLNKAMEKIDVLETAMQLPTKHICYDVELEYLPRLIRVYEAYLDKSKFTGLKTPQLSLSTSIGTESRAPSWRLSRDQQSSVPSENTDPKSPMWTISIDTTVTEWGAAKNDFFTATETSLSEIATQWAVES